MEIIDWLIEHILNLSERWDFLAALFLLSALLPRFRAIKHRASALILPAALLLARKLALFVPVSGAISSEDQVVFWSSTAYWYFFALMLAQASYILWLKYEEEVWPVFVFASPPLMIASAFLLPVDGWVSHLYMPLVSVAGASKILFVSPVLLPVAWITLFFQIGLFLFASGGAGREINKLALICILTSGLAYFSCQTILPQAPIVSEIQKSWETENPAPREGGAGEIQNFINVWAMKLPKMRDLGVNVVEKALPHEPAAVGDQVKKKMTLPWPDFWPGGVLRGSLLAGLAFILLFVGLERLRIGDEQKPGPAQTIGGNNVIVG